MGNVFHKVMEHLAIAKLKEQETGQKGGWDIGDEYIGEFIPDDIYDKKNITKLCKKSYEYHSSISEQEWSDKDLIKAIGWANAAVDFQNGAFDPRNREVVAVEKFFDFEIEKEWAKYDYKIGDKRIQGNLALKGTIDLILKVDEDHYEVLDYKTGKRSDFNTGEEKTLEKLQKDPQLLLYFFACRKIFPHIKYFDFTIYYINDGGPFTVCFDDSSYALAEELIKNRFEEMRDCEKPRLLVPKQEDREKKGNWKCLYCCSFHKEKMKGTDLSICEFFKREIEQKGIEKVTEEHIDWSKFGTYGDGGGRKSEGT